MKKLAEIWNKVREGEEVLKKKRKTLEIIKKRAQKSCSFQTLKDKVPITKWLPVYDTDDLVGDIIAGLTVGLTVIPQGIAYALIAGLPPNYGLYSAFFGSFIYMFFGSSKDITIGPTAIMSILTYEYSHGSPQTANLLCFTSGVIILVLGCFNLGFLTNFVSMPVISGFTSAAAITIFTSQLKGLLGFKGDAKGVVNQWVQTFTHITETKWADLVLGVTSFIVLLLLRKLRDIKRFKKTEFDTRSQKAYKMAIFLLCVGRNAIVVIIATFLSACLDSNQPFTITGDIKPGLPSVQIPHFTITEGNKTIAFTQVMSNVGPGVIILPLVAILENFAIASSFSQGKAIDANQEMIALGLCNLGNSFFQAMPTTGSFSRTAVNANSGVRTPAGGIATGSLIVLALAVLTPYFKYIPLAALAAVVMCAVIFMVEYEDIVPVWKVRRADEVVLWVSFLGCLFWKLEYGIVLGVIVNLIVLLLFQAIPNIEVIPVLEDVSGIPAHIVVIPKCELFYINIEKVRTKVAKTGLDLGQGNIPIIVDCSYITSIDYSAARGFQAMISDFHKRKQPIFFMNSKHGLQKSLTALSTNIIFVEEDVLIDALLGKYHFQAYS
ncbi:Sodium-independent sulfate anion transporter [Armadillidium nasatum]|uniref:Sodium-independent sulfate anion transporter n=1 Tax=Armadillidium nasatum TaxID=96803 RepID=A0A5N5SKN1_9CRUS|nr:Sodium-independent sulfate anion transporter [Armadillidium nasatum]